MNSLFIRYLKSLLKTCNINPSSTVIKILGSIYNLIPGAVWQMGSIKQMEFLPQTSGGTRWVTSLAPI